MSCLGGLNCMFLKDSIASGIPATNFQVVKQTMPPGDSTLCISDTACNHKDAFTLSFHRGVPWTDRCLLQQMARKRHPGWQALHLTGQLLLPFTMKPHFIFVTCTWVLYCCNNSFQAQFWTTPSLRLTLISSILKNAGGDNILWCHPPCRSLQQCRKLLDSSCPEGSVPASKHQNLGHYTITLDHFLSWDKWRKIAASNDGLCQA